MDNTRPENDFMTIAVNDEDLDNVSGEYDNRREEGDNLRLSARSANSHGGPISGRGSSGGRRYLKRRESQPHDRDGEDGIPKGRSSARNAIEMQSLDRRRRRASDDVQSKSSGSISRHRRAKSQHNGFEYYRRMQKLVNAGYQSDPENDSDHDEPDGANNLTLEDLKRTRQFLATVRVRSKSRKKKTSVKAVNGASSDLALDLGAGDDDLDNEEFEEQVGLPSGRQKRKGLAERMLMAKQVDSSLAVAREFHYKDPIWDISFGYSPKDRRPTFNRFVTNLKEWAANVMYNIQFWSPHFKEIEGKFGMAVTTYFRFTRWLVKVNFMVFFLFLCFIYIPKFVVYVNPSKELFVEDVKLNTSSFNIFVQQAVTCSSSYLKYLRNVTSSRGISVVFDIVTGTGSLEDTFLFYGQYNNLTVKYSSSGGLIENLSTNFNMGLAYMLTMVLSFVLVFIAIVQKSSNFIQEVVIDMEKRTVATYTNAVFSSWDYCIDSEKTAFYKQKIIFNMFQAKLEELELKRQGQVMSRKELSLLYVRRCFINFLVILILAGSFASIYFATSFLLEKKEEDLSDILVTLIEFLPSIIISVLNLTVPSVFLLLAEKEVYKPSTSANITILRAVFLRISLVGVLIVSLYYRLQSERERDLYQCPEEGLVNGTSKCCGNALWISRSGSTSDNQKGSVKCWETYVGQQFYKLAVADIFNVCVFNLSFAALRRLIVNRFKDTWWASLIGLYAFDLPVEVLDLVYSQTVCWVGMFFSPLLPLITLAKMMVFFFIKKFILLRLSESPKNIYRASRSYSFFQVILLGAFAIICISLGYMIRNIQPSQSCGPFRVYSRENYVMFDSVTDEIDTWSDILKGIFTFLGTAGFFLPAFIILLLAIYYYWAVSRGYKHMEELLQDQIKSEAYDKQFLLARVDEILKQSDLYKEEEWRL